MQKSNQQRTPKIILTLTNTQPNCNCTKKKNAVGIIPKFLNLEFKKNHTTFDTKYNQKQKFLEFFFELKQK